MEVEGTIPEALKDAIRALEKGLLCADPAEVGDCGVVLDVVRAMLVCDNMRAVAAMVARLTRHTGLRVFRVKERFFKQITNGGWRDVMLNCCLLNPETGAVICIVEVQVVHRNLLTARADLPGRLVYTPVRVAMELLERKMAPGALWWTRLRSRRCTRRRAAGRYSSSRGTRRVTGLIVIPALIVTSPTRAGWSSSWQTRAGCRAPR